MSNEIRCKRIIDGRAYNTETAILLGRWESQHSDKVETLFKTRHGAYFLHHIDEGIPHEWIEPVDQNAVQKWIEENCSASVYEVEFGEAPEAGDPEARITLRIPETLRRRIAEIADSQDQSLNAWIQRWLERGATESAQKEERNESA